VRFPPPLNAGVLFGDRRQGNGWFPDRSAEKITRCRASLLAAATGAR